jgi:FtsH-binding integral membrane protein
VQQKLFIFFKWRNVGVKKWSARLLLLVVFCFPYVYFSMYQDLINSSMIGYGLMIATLIFLISICKKTHNLPVGALGNIISFIASYLLISCSTGEKWSYYFKPFTSVGLLIFVSIAIIILQLVVIGIIKSRKLNDTKNGRNL